MGTIADKLAKLNTTKEELKAALAEKGQTVGDVFSAYPAAVRAIETGGGTFTITNVEMAQFPTSATAGEIVNFVFGGRVTSSSVIDEQSNNIPIGMERIGSEIKYYFVMPASNVVATFT